MLAMSFFHDLAEPAFLVSLFTIGALATRRSPTYLDASNKHLGSPDFMKPLIPLTEHVENRRTRRRTLERGRNSYMGERLNRASRFLWTYPFVLEIWYWNLTYWSYQLLRVLTASLIRGSRPAFELAQQRALQTLSLETSLGLALERHLQRSLINNHPILFSLLTRVYATATPAAAALLLYSYAFLAPPVHRRLRRSLAASNALCFLAASLWRCMPPRLLPARHVPGGTIYGPFADPLKGGTPAAAGPWNLNRFLPTVASTPSLPAATAILLAACLTRLAPHRPVRVLLPIWAAAVAISCLSTANHFLLDVLAGGVVALAAWRLNRLVLVFQPLQDLAFWMLGIQYPEDPWGRQPGLWGDGWGDDEVSEDRRRGRCLD